MELRRLFFLSIQMFSYVAIPKARRRNKINTPHHVPTLTLQYIVATDAATSSLHKFPMANVGSGKRAESSHKKRRMNAFTKLIKPLYYILLLQHYIIAAILFHTCRPIKASYERIHILQPLKATTARPSRRDGHSFKTKWRRIQFFGKIVVGIKTHSHTGCVPTTAW